MIVNETTLHNRPNDTDINNYWSPLRPQELRPLRPSCEITARYNNN